MGSECKNLKVFTHSLAKRVLFDGSKTAIGVVVETGGFNCTLSASKEVILSAGAVSPNSSDRVRFKSHYWHDIGAVPIASAAHGIWRRAW
jgi:choline dehydrogenase-like flavoprotein